MSEDFNISAEPGNDIHYKPGPGTAENPDGGSTFFNGGKGFANHRGCTPEYIRCRSGNLNPPYQLILPMPRERRSLDKNRWSVWLHQ